MDIQIAKLFLDAKEQILVSKEYDSKTKVKALFNLLTSILEEVTQTEKIVFTTLFSRAAFAANKYSLKPKLMYYLHSFRRDNERMRIGQNEDMYLKLGAYVIDELINSIWYNGGNKISLENDVSHFFDAGNREVVTFKPVIEAVVESIDLTSYEIHFYEEDDASSLKTAKFDQLDKNELFTENVQLLHDTFRLPLHVNFIDVEILTDGKYIPSAFVIMPDYLIDVTAVANCFKDYGAYSALRLVDKYKQVENSIPLFVGNVANMFLDEIVSDPSVQFKSLVAKIFKLDPIGLSNLDDKQVQELITMSRIHYLNLKRTVAKDLPNQGIDRENVFLEPSFYSRDFGLQGRLDLFHQNNASNHYDIVELKSGKPFRANIYGLSASHYCQTLLYDLMVKSTFGYYHKPNNYILYSKLPDKSLKYAPPVKQKQYEAIKVRNELIAIEYKMAFLKDGVAGCLEVLDVANFPGLMGFEFKNLEKFQKFYSHLGKVEKAYFTSFSSFIAREQMMSKTGEHGLNKSNGLSALWLENLEEKEDRFSVLKSLTIAIDRTKDSIPSLVLSRNEKTNSLANFRKGDIAVLYPNVENPQAVLKNQIFKCTILDINQKSVEVKLRSKQYNDTLFTSVHSWNIETDSLDSGFNLLYRSIAEFFNAKQATIDLWLGMRPPRPLANEIYKDEPLLTAQQNMILDQMSNTKDYFLLWGPPGTGKTSVMLKTLTKRLYYESEENILLLAYTNRAVDEMCAAIESIDEGFAEHYIRIGSSTSCAKKYKPRLLDQLTSSMYKRSEIKTFIKSKRIFIATVASIVPKVELFKMKKFDRVIIDEASQILEPMILGLLTRVEKTILIGDHKQLPAVVTQAAHHTKINDHSLLDLGITEMSMSLFERLFYRCKHQNWDHSFGVLSFQGRMHNQVMSFPNDYFYEGLLQTLPNVNRLTKSNRLKTSYEELKPLIENRFIYVSTKTDHAFNWKTNQYETEEVLNFVRRFEKLYQENKVELENDSIGIITPYRAQIATIRKSFEEHLPHLLGKITIDTVERYQGGARDIIILSLCTNKLSQLKSLVSLSQEGIDRKLNVAMTRAREQLIILGNPEILSNNETYSNLMKSAYQWE